jgi:hypothetical protein
MLEDRTNNVGTVSTGTTSCFLTAPAYMSTALASVGTTVMAQIGQPNEFLASWQTNFTDLWGRPAPPNGLTTSGILASTDDGFTFTETVLTDGPARFGFVMAVVSISAHSASTENYQGGASVGLGSFNCSQPLVPVGFELRCNQKFGVTLGVPLTFSMGASDHTFAGGFDSPGGNGSNFGNVTLQFFELDGTTPVTLAVPEPRAWPLIPACWLGILLLKRLH